MAQIEVDRALLARIQGDEPGAFEQFVSSYGDRIYAFGVRMCGHREDARDVAQDTLLQAFRSLKKLEHPEALQSWLYRVVSNACLMKRRKGKFEPQRELSLEELMPKGAGEATAEIPDPSDLPDDNVSRKEVQRAVRDAIAELPKHYRVVLVLRDMEQLSTQETADVLDLPESTVKMRLHRARLMVRKQLVERGGRRES